jgi:hypothetical protein
MTNAEYEEIEKTCEQVGTIFLPSGKQSVVREFLLDPEKFIGGFINTRKGFQEIKGDEKIIYVPKYWDSLCQTHRGGEYFLKK